MRHQRDRTHTEHIERWAEFVKTHPRKVQGGRSSDRCADNYGKYFLYLHRNLVERFSEFYGNAPVDYFDVIDTADIKPKRIKISEGYRRCNLMSLRIQASPELLKFAYDAGLGEKNAMGFGCVDLINCSQHTKNLTADEHKTL